MAELYLWLALRCLEPFENVFVRSSLQYYLQALMDKEFFNDSLKHFVLNFIKSKSK